MREIFTLGARKRLTIFEAVGCADGRGMTAEMVLQVEEQYLWVGVEQQNKSSDAFVRELVVLSVSQRKGRMQELSRTPLVGCGVEFAKGIRYVPGERRHAHVLLDGLDPFETHLYGPGERTTVE